MYMQSKFQDIFRLSIVYRDLHHYTRFYRDSQNATPKRRAFRVCLDP